MQNDEPPFVLVVLTTVFGLAVITWLSASKAVRRQRQNLQSRLWATIIERAKR